MNKTKLLSLIALGAISTLSFVNGQEAETLTGENFTGNKARLGNVKMIHEARKETKQEMKPKFDETRGIITGNRQQIHANWTGARDEFGYLRSYLKTDLTQDQIKEILSGHKVKMDQVKALLSGLNETNYEEVKLQLIDLYKNSLDALNQYVDETKLEAFNEYKEKIIEVFTKNIEMRIENIMKRNELRNEHKRLLTEKLTNKFTNQINKIPAEKKEAVLNKMLEKVNKQIANIQNSQMKNKELVINALNEIVLIIEDALLDLENAM